MTEDIHSRLVRHAGAVCLSTAVEVEASERIKALEKDRAALMDVVRKAIAMRSVVHDSDLIGEPLLIAEQGLKDALDEAIDALLDHLTEAAKEDAR